MQKSGKQSNERKFNAPSGNPLVLRCRRRLKVLHRALYIVANGY
jgi:hypothetical protein